MTSARIRKRKAVALKQRGSPNAGRTAQDGARYPSGDLRPPKPNQRVLEQRRAMLGNSNADVTMAENWMDLCLARGWLTEERHRILTEYANLYERAGFNLPSFKVFDADRVRGYDSQLGDSKAMSLIRNIWVRLHPAQAHALFSACVKGQWPEFVQQMVRTGHVSSPWNVRRDALFIAIDRLGDLMGSSKARAA